MTTDPVNAVNASPIKRVGIIFSGGPAPGAKA